MSTQTSEALEQKNMGPGAIVEQYKQDISLVLPTHVNPDQFVRIAQGVLRRDSKLAQVARQNVGSFMSAILECARLGLEPGDTYHFVPIGGEVVGMSDWKGEVELIYRAGAVASVKAEVVYANDDFAYNPGTMAKPNHDPEWFGDRGEMIGAYAYAEMKDGATSRVIVMNRAEIEKVKKVSKSSGGSSSPWKQWEDRMWRKTVVHQLYKWVPSSPEYRQELARSMAEAEKVAINLGAPPPSPDYDPDTGEIHPDDNEVAEGELVDDET